jgi:hypothetical protein
MGTTAVAAATAGLFARAAPDKEHHRDQYHCQEKELLPIHAANITVKGNRATGIFKYLILLFQTGSVIRNVNAEGVQPRQAFPH